MLCVSRMNSVLRKKFYKIIVERDGEYCRCCGALPHEHLLVIDHRDNNNSNNSSENLQLLCKSCNYRKNPRPVDKCVREKENENQSTSELEQSQKMEPQFRKYIIGRIEEQGEVSEKKIIVEAAEAIGNSQVSNKRYLEKMCSVEGPCYRKKVGDTVMVRLRQELNFK